jgi:single-stranded DNA-specific DHH superfamily exonuclease
MALTEYEIARIREAFTESVRPVILFDDDPDGLASFLLIYNHVKDGKGIPVKNAPEIGLELARTVNDYSPDLVVILDMPMVSQEFIDEISTRIIWLDHHPLQERKKVEYYNPRKHDLDDNRPTSYWAYKAMQENIWIAMCGIVSDWFMPEENIRQEFIKKYPELLPEDITKPEEALHKTPLGKLIRTMAFNMKGRTSDVIKSMKVFTRIKEPNEILEQTTAAGKYIYKKFQQLDEEYQELLKQVDVTPKEKLVLFTYTSNAHSFSTELSNEIMFNNPDKIVLVAWEYNGEYKCSLRSANHHLPNLIEKSLKGVSGYGGGHDHAAGACIKKEDFNLFVENIRKQVMLNEQP